jgi:hypothetical protein
MTERDADQPLEFDDLEPLPEGAELTELPELTEEAELIELPEEVEALEPLPAEEPEPAPVPAAKPAPVPAAKPAPAPAPVPAAKPAPAPVAEPAPAPAPTGKVEAAPAAKAAAPKPAPAPKASPVATAGAPLKPGAVSSSTGSRRERMEQEREARTASKKKAPTWVRFEGPGEKPKREMEQAPIILRKAALWLLIGCVLPWGGYTTDWTGNIVEKLLVLAGLYTWHQAHLLRDGAKTPGFIQSLGKSSFLPLFVVSGLLAVLGFSPLLSMESLSAGFKESSGPFAEKGFMILAGLTLTHIYDYEHGGRFNPMFPIMFLAPAIAGVMALLRVFGAENMNIGVLLGGGGAILVSVAGSMAAYTMYVALKEAKAHGEAKRAAKADARKAARSTRR